LTRREAVALLEAERARIRHYLFQNTFGGGLQPGFKDGRLSSEDVVFRALEGGGPCLEDVRAAVSAWGDQVFPAIEQFIELVPKLGFVPASAWHDQLAGVRTADFTIRSLLGLSLPVTDKAACKLAAEFWKACDLVDEFLRRVRDRPDELFIRWEPPALIS
jgi:hypothetical protein